MFLFFRKFHKISPLLGFFILIIGLLIYQIVSNNLLFIVTQLGLSSFLRIETLENLSGRGIAWEFAWQQIQENFFIGNGFSYTEYIFTLNQDYLSALGHQGHAHNAYLTIWLDLGLVGLIFFLVALFFTFFNASIYNRLALPVLYVILFSNYFESWITASLNPFTIQLLFFLTFAFIQKESNNLSSESVVIEPN